MSTVMQAGVVILCVAVGSVLLLAAAAIWRTKLTEWERNRYATSLIKRQKKGSLSALEQAEFEQLVK
ncbi:hypothetical protein KC906_02755 [Candidatus Kaiserbacteria bacterium]|nr:hypothetical protein [Candidatus Kaiserbacteria bacterium]MCB9812332.1 hypothetical protein [Candidatus Nomurabacteria bacterium]